MSRLCQVLWLMLTVSLCQATRDRKQVPPSAVLALSKLRLAARPAESAKQLMLVKPLALAT
jgi:hypothetical protein